MTRTPSDIERRAEKLWASILASSLSSIYLAELRQLSSTTVEAIDAAIGHLTEPPPGKALITINHEVHRLLVQAVTASARVRALCWDRGRGQKESPLQYEVRRRRAAWLRTFLEGVDLAPLSDAQVRHTLEHFDEYVDQLGVTGASGRLPLPALVPVDMVLSERHLLEQFSVGQGPPATYWVRVYISGESRFINCGHEVDIAALRATGAAIRDRMTAALGPGVGEDGSFMLVLTPQSFP